MVTAGSLLIIVQLAYRGWALYPSWFFLDDYSLLIDAHGQRLDLNYLVSPYGSHLMPGGRLIAWFVEGSGRLDWSLAASVTLVLTALTSIAALWMLATLFGLRWGTLVPLAIYLSGAMTAPALMWWTVGLNQIALQCSFFLAVGAWVNYLRARRIRWLVATALAVCLGLFFFERALLIILVLLYLAVGYFASGSPRRRLVTVLRSYWPSALVGGLIGGGYLGYYLHSVPRPFTESTLTLTGQIADNMLGTAFLTGALGGPWVWSSPPPPTALAAPPDFAVHLSWVAATLVIIYAALRRHGTLRSWGLLTVYLTGLLALLVNSTAPAYGSAIGLEYRYLTDASCALALCVGLAFLPLGGAVQPSRPRDEPLLRMRLPTATALALVIELCVSGVVSTTRYVNIWHSENASDPYLHNLAADLRTQGTVDLVDGSLPDAVSLGVFPNNALHQLVPLVSDRASFPEASPRLAVVADDGTIRQAVIEPGVLAKPGHKADCGWPVDWAGRTIALTGPTFDFEWWLRIGYVSSADSTVVVTAGSSSVKTEIDVGANSLYVRAQGAFDSVRINGLAPGVTLCVDTIEVGQPVPGGRLP